MVKPDCSVDYFATLGVPETADDEEIRKAYKKLAMKWHPDRNRGNETEANNRFQEVGAALAILTDPTLRQKYENGRAKANGINAFASPPGTANGTGGGGRPNMAPRQAFANFGAPQQPPRPGQAQPSPRWAKSPPQSGADRYARYTADPGAWGAGSGKPHESPKRASAASDYSAWDRMRPGAPAGGGGGGGGSGGGANPARSAARPEPSPNAFRDRPMRSAGDGRTAKERAGWSTDADPRVPPTAQRPPPPTAQQSQPQQPPRPQRPASGGAGLSRSNTVNTPRKHGWAPGTLGGDEPPAQNTSAYYNVHQRGDHQGPPPAARPQSYAQPASARPPSHSQPPSASAAAPQKSAPARPDHLKSFRSPGSDERLRTPYATSGGEKTYFNSESFRRVSHSGSNLHAGWQEAEQQRPSRDHLRSPPSERHRSASPRMRSPGAPGADAAAAAAAGGYDSDTSSDENNDIGPGRTASRDPATRPKAQPRRRRGRPSGNAANGGDDNQPDTNGASDGNLGRTGRTTWSHEELNGAARSSAAAEAAQPRRASGGEAPEGFQQHRLRREHDRGAGSPSRLRTSPPVEKSRSWRAAADRHFDPPLPNTNGSAAGGSGPPQPQPQPPPKAPKYEPNSSSARARLHVTPLFPVEAAAGGSPPDFTSRLVSSPEWRELCEGAELLPVEKSISSGGSGSSELADDEMEWSLNDPGKAADHRCGANSSSTTGQNPVSPTSHVFGNGDGAGRPAFGAASQPANLNGITVDVPLPTAPNGVFSPEGGHASSSMPPPPPPQGPTVFGSPPKPVSAKFSPDDWTDHFKEPSWAFPRPAGPGGVASPVRPKARPKPTTAATTSATMNGAQRTRPTVPLPARVDDAPEHGAAGPTGGGLAPGAGPSDRASTSSGSSAMDLDHTPPGAQKPAPPLSNGASTFSPPPQQPMRPGDHAHPAGSRASTGTFAPPLAGPDPHAHLNLADLKDTAPLGPSGAGLGDMRDLHADLPFESGASAAGPTGPAGHHAPPSATSSSSLNGTPARGSVVGDTALHTTPQRLALPNPPAAPPPPPAARARSTGGGGGGHGPNGTSNAHGHRRDGSAPRLSAQDWAAYCAAVRAYLAEWNAFNKRMLAHFNAREARVETELAADAWVGARGDAGYRRYVAGLEEDVRVRTHWDVSWEHHIQAMRVYGDVRKMAQLGRFV